MFVRPFNLLVKPCGGDCNLACEYCFYRTHNAGRMTEDVLRRTLESYCALPFSGKSVTFQGGEPTLAGLDFFRAADAFPIDKSIQTNATLIDGRWAEFLAAGRWLAGVSVDGPEELHDAGRGRGSFSAALAGVRRLEAAGAEYNILSVVSQRNVRRAREVYRFLKDNFKTRFFQFIECTTTARKGSEGNLDLTISGDEWGDFLVELFDEWSAADVDTVSVRNFDSMFSELMYGRPTQCSFASACLNSLVVEHDGSVYPCDFAVDPEWRLGNVATDRWEDILVSEKLARFAERKLEGLPEDCAECEFWRLCRGDCPRSRRNGKSVLCDGWRKFFAHALKSPLLSPPTNDQ